MKIAFRQFRTTVLAALLALGFIAKGNTWFNDHFSKTVRDALAKPGTQANSTIDLLAPREREGGVLLAKSHPSKEVAAKLNRRTKTPENHRTNLMRKLEVHAVAGVIRYVDDPSGEG